MLQPNDRVASRRKNLCNVDLILMFTQPKSFAEILATATKAPQKHIKCRNKKTESNRSFKDNLSIFSPLVEPSTCTTIAESSSFNTSRESDIANLCFDDPVTPQTLGAALRIKEVGMDVDLEEIEDLFDDDLERHTWVFSLPYTFQYISYAL